MREIKTQHVVNACYIDNYYGRHQDYFDDVNAVANCVHSKPIMFIKVNFYIRDHPILL
jgi:hypothetical protein